MLQELKEILGIIKDLPHMVMWVLAGLLLYKVVVIGSIYGVIKLAIDRLHDWLTRPRTVTHVWKLESFYMIDDAKSALSGFLHAKIQRSTNYTHLSDVNEFIRIYKLGEEADAKLKAERLKNSPVNIYK